MPEPAEPLTLSVECQITEKELVRALRYQDWGEPQARRRNLLRASGFSVAGIALVVAGVTLEVTWLAFSGILAFAVGFYWPLILWSHPKSLARFYAKQPRFHTSSTVVVRPETLAITSPQGDLYLDWHSIREIAVAGDLTLFVLGRYQLVTLPWRVFEAPSAAQRFTELAREYWLVGKDAPRRALAVSKEVADALGPAHLVVQYDLTEREIRRLVLRQLGRKPRTLVYWSVVSLVLGTFFWLLGGPLVGIGVALGIVLLIPALVVGMAIFGVRGAKGVLGPHLLAIGPGALWSITGSQGQTWGKWSSITAIEGNPREILLYRGPDLVTCIPRRCFASPEEADRFLTQATRWHVATRAESPSPSV